MRLSSHTRLHVSLDSPPDPGKVAATIDRLGDLGLDVHITEMDVRDVPADHGPQLPAQASLRRALERTRGTRPLGCESRLLHRRHRTEGKGRDWGIGGDAAGDRVQARNRPGGRLRITGLAVGAPGFEPGTSATPLQRASLAAPRPERTSSYHVSRKLANRQVLTLRPLGFRANLHRDVCRGR